MSALSPAVKVLLAGAAALALLLLVTAPQGLILLAIWVAAFAANIAFASRDTRVARAAVPVIFGLTILVLWELTVRLFDVPGVILPAPSAIASAFANNIPTLWGDFVQTCVKGALSGYVIGAVAAFTVALIADRFAFLKRGLLPVGNFMAALPIVGTAPILVMWFGFDWESKAAVVMLLVFFPILVNTVAGLTETQAMQRDLMRTYGASYWQGLAKLRIPAAMPFVFNGLKISTTLALVGAIVAEFFGSPIQGVGFRISVSVGQLALDMVWAEIVVAALAGSLFYGIIAFIENRVTFWHPSNRA